MNLQTAEEMAKSVQDNLIKDFNMDFEEEIKVDSENIKTEPNVDEYIVNVDGTQIDDISMLTQEITEAKKKLDFEQILVKNHRSLKKLETSNESLKIGKKALEEEIKTLKEAMKEVSDEKTGHLKEISTLKRKLKDERAENESIKKKIKADLSMILEKL